MSETIEVRHLGRLAAAVRVPGSKSYTQRALAAASLAGGRSILRNPLISEDTEHLIEALRLLGTDILVSGEYIMITGTAGKLRNPARDVYLGNNGTAARFLIGLVSLGTGDYRLTGSVRLCERPMGPLLNSLRALGGASTCEGKEGYLPVTIHGRGIRGGRVTFGDVESSQYLSSLLICTPLAEGDVEINVEGNLASKPYVGMTLEVMRHFGVSVENGGGERYRVKGGQRYRGSSYSVEGDASTASYFFLAAALCGGTVRVLNLPPVTAQGDGRFLTVLEKLGCSVSSAGSWVEVTGKALKGGEFVFDMGDMPDMVPTLAVLSAVRPGRTVIRNAAHLRIKESDRLKATARELAKTGIRVEETQDGLIITGGNPRGAEIETYDDHRIAMSFAMLGLAVPGIRIQDPGCVKKSFPGFWEELNRLSENHP